MGISYGIKEGWEFAAKNLGSMYAAHMSESYLAEINKMIQQLADDVNYKAGSKESVDTLKGFIAEYWHADTFNVNAALKGNLDRANIEKSNKLASVDVKIDSGKTYSMKYYATADDSAKQQATNYIQAYHKYLSKSKIENPMTFEEYMAEHNYPKELQEQLMSVYQGQGRIIPAEQLEEAIKAMERKIATVASQEGINRAAVLESYKETLSNLADRIKNDAGVESVPLTKEEAETIAKLCKSGEFKPEDFGFSLDELITQEYIIQQTLNAGVTSAVITVVLQIGPEIYKAIDYLIQNGEIDVGQMKKTGLKALSVSAEGFLRGSISASLTIICRAGKLGTQFTDISPGVVGAFTAIVMDTMKNGFEVARGKMTEREMATQLTKELIVSSVAVMAGTVGQALLPEIPVLGYMLGSFIGSVTASITINIGEKTLLSFAVDTGFSFFGLVEQNYELPKEVIEFLGLEIVELDYVELNRTLLNRVSLSRTSLNKKKYNTIDIMVLRRGVIGVNKVGYVV